MNDGKVRGDVGPGKAELTGERLTPHRMLAWTPVRVGQSDLEQSAPRHHQPVAIGGRGNDRRVWPGEPDDVGKGESDQRDAEGTFSTGGDDLFHPVGRIVTREGSEGAGGGVTDQMGINGNAGEATELFEGADELGRIRNPGG